MTRQTQNVVTSCDTPDVLPAAGQSRAALVERRERPPGDTPSVLHREPVQRWPPEEQGQEGHVAGPKGDPEGHRKSTAATLGTMQMPHRRKTALATFAIALAPLLSSCGFDNATDYENSITGGTTNREASVDVLSAHIVSDQAGRGVFIASLANNDLTEAVTLTGITSEEADVAAFAPVEVPREALVNLVDDEFEPIQVTDQGTEFGAVATKATKSSDDEHADETHAATEAYDENARVVGGKYVRVTLQFSTKETVTVNVPVVRNCGYYAEIPGVAAGSEICASGNDHAVEGH
jgi:hypothetical protein